MSSETHRPTSRILDILEILAKHTEGLGLSQISRAVGIPVSTIHPFLHTLCARGYVDCQPKSMTYTLGAKTLQIAAGFASRDIYTVTRQEMQRVVDTCCEICHLGILDGSNVLYIAKIESPEPLRLVSKVGVSLPASCTALGKALLCEHSLAEVKALYPDGLPVLTPHSITNINAFYEQLLLVRAGEFACDIDEAHMHLRCFALPIRFENRIDAAISVSLPDFRLSQEKENCVRHCLLRARDAIQRHLHSAGRGFSIH